MEKKIKMDGVEGQQYMYHDPCHSPMKTYDPTEVTSSLMSQTVPLNDKCCGESGTFAATRPDTVSSKIEETRRDYKEASLKEAQRILMQNL